MRYCLIFILSAIQIYSTEVSVSLTYGIEKLGLDKYYQFNTKDSVRITKLKIFISNVSLLKNDKEVWRKSRSYHLVDMDNVATLTIIKELPPIDYDKISIGLGIDSTTNVSGALGGDLDPTKGMYWTWQSGYINIKIEGNCNLIKNRNNEFQLHLGGYQFPNYTYLETQFPAKQDKDIIIELDIKELLEKIQIAEISHIMSPSKTAKNISLMISKMLKVQLND